MLQVQEHKVTVPKSELNNPKWRELVAQRIEEAREKLTKDSPPGYGLEWQQSLVAAPKLQPDGGLEIVVTFAKVPVLGVS